MTYHAVDFGTSNTLLSFVDGEKIIPVPLDSGGSLIMRSVFYTPEKNVWFMGQEAIDEYVKHVGEGRFFRSVKKFLPEATYVGTDVFNRKLTIVDLVAVFLGELRKRADAFTGATTKKIVLGRPALYSLEHNLDKLAQDRMEAAAKQAGYTEVLFCPEPVAAGLDFNSGKLSEKIVLIADFGGGTSDFTLMRSHGGTYSQKDILGLSGVFLAGDALDGVMMKDFIAPHFGSQFAYQLPGGQNILKFPRGLLTKLCSPAHITHLREKDTWEFLQHITKFALSPEDQTKMENLFTLVECQLGFPLFYEIEKTKIALGKTQKAQFRFDHVGLELSQEIPGPAYAISVTPTVGEIMETMKDVFRQSGKDPEMVDEVVLTGGTSQFPPIRESLQNFFGKDRLSDHNVYQSVVNGLARFATKLS